MGTSGVAGTPQTIISCRKRGRKLGVADALKRLYM